MIYIDELLAAILNSNVRIVLARDTSDVLTSMGSQLESKTYVTENQSRLLLRLLNENAVYMTQFEPEFSNLLANPRWRHPFRQLQVIKKLYIGKNTIDEECIVAEMQHSPSIKKEFLTLTREFENVTGSVSGKHYFFDLTEKNLVKLVDKLTPLDFEIDPVIQGHYSTITSWHIDTYKSQFEPATLHYSNYQRVVNEDIGAIEQVDPLLLRDRAIRYQYMCERNESPSNLTETIANRQGVKVWVDHTAYTLGNVFESLKTLDRLPTLIVFDSWAEPKTFEVMSELAEALDQNGVTNVGVYFRMENTEEGKKFNQLVADKKYNQKLDATTQVVVVQSGKLPKFLLKNDWRPMSALAVNTRMGLRHGKVSVYAACTDLIVEYAEEPVLIDKRTIKWP